MLYAYFLGIPQRLHSDAGESPKSKTTTSQILYTLKLLKLPSYSFAFHFTVQQSSRDGWA